MTVESLDPEQKQQFQLIEQEIHELLDAADFDQARGRVEFFLRSVPQTPDWEVFRAGLYARAAECLLELEEEEEAIEAAKQALKGGWATSHVYTVLGWAMFHQDELEVAQTEFNSALDLDSENVRALIGRSLVLRELGELDLTLSDLEHLLSIDAEYAGAYPLLVEIELELSHVGRAQEVLATGREKWPEDPELALLDAQLKGAAGATASARQALDCVFAHSKEGVVPLEGRLLESELLLRSGETKAARKAALQTSNLYLDEAFAFVQLAAAQLLDGRAAGALKAAERAVELDPSLPDAYAVRAAAYFESNDPESAAKDLSRIDNEIRELPYILYGAAIDTLVPELKIPTYAKFLDRSMQSAPPSSGSKVSKLAKEEEGERGPERSETTGSPFDSGSIPNNPFAGGNMPKMPPGFDPSSLLDQMFDSEGNVRPMLKPILKMAIKNAPSILKTMPSNLFDKQGIDTKAFEQANLDKMTDEEFDKQMKLLYDLLKQAK